MKRQLITLVLVLMVTVLAGCHKRALLLESGDRLSSPVDFEASPLTHEVRYRGETLTAIALWYTGNARNWSKIAAYNGGLNPLSIRLGARIDIPHELVSNRTPFPRPKPRLAEERVAALKQREVIPEEHAVEAQSIEQSTKDRLEDHQDQDEVRKRLWQELEQR